MPHRTPKLLLAAATATLVMSVTAAVGPFTLFWTNETRNERNLVEQQLDSIRTVQGLLVDAETGERGYALTGMETFLRPYYVATSQLPSAIKALREHYESDPPSEITQVEAFIEQTRLKLDHLEGVIKLRSTQGATAAMDEIATGNGKHLMDQVRDLGSKLIQAEVEEVAILDNQLNANLRWAVAISIASFLLTLMLGRFIYVSMRQTIKRQADSTASALSSSIQLSDSLKDLERRNTEIGLLAEMARLLQTEMSQEETLQLVSTYCQQLLEGSSGTLYLYRNSTDALKPAASWGHAEAQPDVLMGPKDCWAIRRGHPHVVERRHELRCAHYSTQSTFEDGDIHWCLPLIAYGETLGLLHIQHSGANGEREVSRQFAEAAAEQTALALANGRMRQVLQVQSIKDPLTGLYNRRFMEETLKRELSKATRDAVDLSVIMLDLDNFKKLNDIHGHSAGDAVLRSTAALLMKSIRATDVACRFGGEELIVILPDCSMEDALLRAESIRASLESMSPTDGVQTFSVTASFGVASTTRNGTDQALLIQAADAALYKAKRAGKNRVAS
ncbi:MULTISPECIES: sensor domain-containing diguanylate cyclase [unclassified Pseudomonas]|uniref:sensor domain-containing diguanylate cyclase n=1 Tax=unclassified Pseudomonas TaxID=196821 RepID=UPI0039B741A0